MIILANFPTLNNSGPTNHILDLYDWVTEHKVNKQAGFSFIASLQYIRWANRKEVSKLRISLTHLEM